MWSGFRLNRGVGKVQHPKPLRLPREVAGFACCLWREVWEDYNTPKVRDFHGNLAIFDVIYVDEVREKYNTWMRRICAKWLKSEVRFLA